MNKKKWKRTNDIVGHKPKFRVYCRFCDEDMICRYSAVFPEPNLLHGFTVAGNQLAFKCPTCGYHIRFNVPDDKEYIDKIYALRQNKSYHHSLEEWEENELIKKQLEALGYWGGREG